MKMQDYPFAATVFLPRWQVACQTMCSANLGKSGQELPGLWEKLQISLAKLSLNTDNNYRREFLKQDVTGT